MRPIGRKVYRKWQPWQNGLFSRLPVKPLRVRLHRQQQPANHDHHGKTAHQAEQRCHLIARLRITPQIGTPSPIIRLTMNLTLRTRARQSSG